jgi:uncharacterized membrane protein YhhN
VTGTSTALLIAAGTLALVDWVAVGRQNARLEYVTKPATLVALIGATVALEPEIDGRRIAVVVALVLSLAGDIFLMLRHSEPGGPTQKGYFVQGLAAFLLAHIAYVAAFQIEGGAVWLVLLLFVVLRAATLPITARLTGALRSTDQGKLAGPIRAYAIAITGMVAAVTATGDPLAIAGAFLFLASDLLIAWSRFVTPWTWAPVGIIVTYHLGQMGLVLSLAFD